MDIRGYGIVGQEWFCFGSGDLNGDAGQDLFWQNAATGQVGCWSIEQNGKQTWSNLDYAAPEWSPLLVGDLDSDGFSDIFWSNLQTGQVGYWNINNGEVENWFDLGEHPKSWNAVASGDFNGNGSDDILWRSEAANLAYWDASGFAPFYNYQYTGADTFLVSGDFNGDGQDESLWSNTGYIYTIAENNIRVDILSKPNLPGVSWHAMGASDFNGDGTEDILWRDEVTDQTGYWKMQGGQIAGWEQLGYVVTNWAVENVGDYAGDERADILWRNSADGELIIWDL